MASGGYGVDRLRFFHSDIFDFLREEVSRTRYDLISLSNVADWIPSDDLLGDCLAMCRHAIAPGGAIVLRSSFGTLHSRLAACGVPIDVAASAALLGAERSLYFGRYAAGRLREGGVIVVVRAY